MSTGQWVFYLVLCSDDTLYCGVTKDLENRLVAHNTGTEAKHTKARRPVEFVCASRKMSKSEAFQFEQHIKRLPAHRKPAEITMANR
jgi:putative endonuclease